MSLPAARLIQYERLQAPADSGAVLIEPGVRALRGLLADAGAAALDRVALLDSTVGAIRRELRAALGVTRPLVLTGHQPEFFHAGVFAKSIAAARIAQHWDAAAAFLAVDSDAPKTAELVVPEETASGPRRVSVPIPGLDPQRAFELQEPRPRSEWLQFFAAAGALHRDADQSLLGGYARGWMTTASHTPDYVDAFTCGQGAAEGLLGVTLPCWRMSALSTTRAFRAFAAHLALHARRVAATYNAAQQQYRARHAVRAAGRPVPPLRVSDGRVELPLWVVRGGEPRHRVFVRPLGSDIEFSAGQAVLAVMSAAALGSAATHGAPWPLEADGWGLRPRALALSAFARLFLADLFLHGIGGAKYDEIMEDFVAALLGSAPRPAACVTATLHLRLRSYGVRPEELGRARRQARDLRYNPQRHLSAAPPDLLAERARLVQQADTLRRTAPRQHAARREVFRALRRANEALLASDPWRAAAYDERIAAVERAAQHDRVARDREYFWALHHQGDLAALVERIDGLLRGADT